VTSPAPPSGIITLLFTDIEGSTQLWERHPVAMRAALARHDELMRAAVARHGGHVFKTIGDAFCVAFQDAAAGLAAAVEAQRELAGLDWGEVGRIRVRMGLHRGTTDERDGDYSGPTVNRVARLMSVGHGGQVLLSDAVVQAAGTSHAMKDHGARRLKDLVQPERIYEVLIDGVGGDFPPLRTLDQRPNNLPAESASFVGRDSELAGLLAVLRGRSNRVVTVTGPAGIGKSRLALQAAAELLEERDHGVFHVDAEALDNAVDVGVAIRVAIGVELGSAAAAGRELLVVIDNADRVRDLGELIARAIAASPRLQIVAARREPLGVAGEQEWPLGGLELPDQTRSRRNLVRAADLIDNPAAELFVQRARAARPDFTLTDDNAGAVAEICNRLDGVPLAIELAAARVKLMPPRAIAARLDSALSLLSRGGAGRQSTLRGAIEWGYELLEPSEQELFRRWSYFPSSFTIEAAEALAMAEPATATDVFDCASALVDRSLLRAVDADDDPRFSMLGAIRQFGGDKRSESGIERVVARAHAEFFSGLLTQVEARLRSSPPAQLLARLDHDEANLQLALEWLIANGDRTEVLGFAATIWHYWFARGMLQHTRAHLGRVLATHGDGEPSRELARILNGLAIASTRLNDPESAKLHDLRALEIWTSLGDRAGVAETLMSLAFAAYQSHEHDAAAESAERALAIQRELGDGRAEADILGYLGFIKLGAGRVDAARSLMEQSAGAQRRLDNRWGLSNSLFGLGHIARMEGDLTLARAMYSESLAMRRDLNVSAGIVSSVDGIASIDGLEGDHERAVRLAAATRAFRAELGMEYTTEIEAETNTLIERSRLALGPERAREIEVEGAAMSIELAIELAFSRP
jgi:predicted ATPase/class 3 adenylate cyclase